MTSLPGLNLIFHSIRQGGGMERHVLDLIAYAAQQNVPMRVITRKLDWPGPLPRGVEFQVLHDWTPFNRLNTLLFESRAFAKRRAEWPAIGISRVPGVDLCIVGGTHLGHLQDRGNKRAGFYDRRTASHEHAMYGGARTIVAHSGKVASEIVALYGVDASKVRTLYPPVNTDVFSLAARAGREAMRQALGISPQQLLLLFPSNNHTLKGADLILKALQNLDPRLRLVVAGKTPLNAPNAINLGFRQDMPALYAAADAVILASHYEAFGLVGPEAVLCGTPALFANTVGAAEVLSEDACIRFDRTVPSLQSALQRALTRFESGTLALHEPGLHIRYPYSLPQHFDAVFALLADSVHA